MCGQSTMRAMAPNASFPDGSVRTTDGQGRELPSGFQNSVWDKQLGVGLFKHAISKASPKTQETFKNVGKESTPPLPKSSGDSGLSIRRSSRSSSNTSNRRGGSRSGARKRFKTT
jgi:hypothetical protein